MWPMVIAAAVSAAAPLLGKALAAGDRAEAERIRKQVLDSYGPEALSKLEVDAQETGPSEWENYKPDEQAMAAQRRALKGIEDDASTVGMTAAERAELADAMGQTAQQEQGQRGAIMANAQARGVGGSGFELAAQLSNQQGAAMRNSRAGSDAASMAARRRALAQMQLAEVGGKMRGQGLDEFASRAGAMDSIARFNAGQRSGAQRYNSGMSRYLMDTRADLMGGQAGASDAYARETQEAVSQAGQGISDAFGAYGMNEMEKKKKG